MSQICGQELIDFSKPMLLRIEVEFSFDRPLLKKTMTGMSKIVHCENRSTGTLL